MSESDGVTRIPLKRETRDDIIRPNLRGGETYDSLLRRVFEQYDDPATVPENPPEIH